MSDLKSLDPEIRAFALVGQYLKRWSEMEASLHEAIGIAMNLDETKRYILCANIRLQEKVQIIRTLVDVSSLQQSEKDSFKRQLAEIIDRSYTRNMMAHDAFKPDNAGDGVIFLSVKAKGSFSLPAIVWSAQKFEDEGLVVNQYAALLAQLKVRLTGVIFNFGNVDWMASMSQPMRRTMSPTLIDFLSHQTPIVLSTDPAIGGTPAQIPQKPDGSE